MEITNKDIEIRYSVLSDSELIDLYDSEELTDMAFSLLKGEFNERGLTEDRVQTIRKERRKGDTLLNQTNDLLPLPKMWIGFLLAIGLFIGMLIQAIFEIESEYGLIAAPIGLIGLVYWLHCVQRYHQILNWLTTIEYSISPGRAVGFHFIPLYNLYWIFKWPIEMSKFLNQRGEVGMLHGGFIGLIILISIVAYRAIDGTLGLICLFLLGVYINSILKKHISINN